MLNPACCAGHVHEGSPEGQVISIAGQDCYVIDPPAGQPRAGGILFCTDALGLELVNNKLLCDKFAKQGYVVVMPDVFNGAPLPVSFLEGMEQWPKMGPLARARFVLWGLAVMPSFLMRHAPATKKMPGVHKVLEASKEKYSVANWGAVGYCYGGKLVASLAAEADAIRAGAVAHPSFLNVPADIEALQQPMLFCCAEHDMVFKAPQRQQAEELLKQKAPEKHKFIDYPGTKHGFAVRGGPDDEKARQDAFDAMVSWFKQHLQSS